MTMITIEGKKTLTEWAEEYGFTLLDPDGFDRRDPELATRLFTREEWDSGWPRCTLSCIREGRAYHGTPAFAAPEQAPPGGWRKVAQVEALGHKDDEVRGSVERDIFMRKRCPDCQVQPGQVHLHGCDIEQCSACGWQKLQCDCAEHDPAFARWSGFWPGKLEALALGMDLNTLAASGIHAVLMTKPKEEGEGDLTVDKAFAILAERCWWRSRTDDGDQEHVEAEKKAARALALAAVREVMEMARNSVPVDWAVNLRHVEKINCDAIEALGSEDD